MPRNTLRTLARLFLGGLTAAAALLPAERASASYLVIPPPAVAEASAAYKYANMTGAEALAELDKRKVPYKVADPISGVTTPVRLTGKLHGVYIHSSIPESQRATSVYEVLDARLALALDDFAKILERHDIEEVVHYSLYRPNVSREEHDEAGHVAARAAAQAEKEAEVASKTPEKPAVATTGNHGVAAKQPVTTAAKQPVTTATKLPVVTTAAKPGHKPAVTTVAKVTPAAKPHAKSSVPVAGTKALPQPLSKGGAGAHGQKRKDPLVVDKPSVTNDAKAPLPALPAPAAKHADAPGAHAANAPVHASAHPKMTANNASVAPRGRTGVGSKASAKAPVATKTTTSATPAKGAVVSAPAKAAVSAKGPVAAVPAKGALPAKGPVAHTALSNAKAPSVATPASNGVVGAAKNAPLASKAAESAPVSRQTWAPPGTRHPAGLAIDVALLKKRDGQWISVARDFGGKIGAKTCGDGVRTADTPEGRELRSLVCEANDQGVFTYVLTPNFNAAHYDHFHMEIRPTVKWFMYH
ncbi:MAG: extensin family protein [Polyangiaceae bacterium]